MTPEEKDRQELAEMLELQAAVRGVAHQLAAMLNEHTQEVDQ